MVVDRHHLRQRGRRGDHAGPPQAAAAAARRNVPRRQALPTAVTDQGGTPSRLTPGNTIALLCATVSIMAVLIDFISICAVSAFALWLLSVLRLLFAPGTIGDPPRPQPATPRR